MDTAIVGTVELDKILGNRGNSRWSSRGCRDSVGSKNLPDKTTGGWSGLGGNSGIRR
jgi:hypothetical protein